MGNTRSRSPVLPAAQKPDRCAPHTGIALREAFRVWLRVALLSFGGPAGQIAVMHRILVEERRWISEARFLHALNYCMLLPGPEAQQLAIYIGWLMHRTLGGLVAGVLFVLPGVIALMALSWIYVIWGNVGVVAGLFFGLKAAVLAVVIEAVLRVGRRALKSRLAVVIAVAAFVALFFFAIPFPLVVLAAALIGFAADRLGYAVGGPLRMAARATISSARPSRATRADACCARWACFRSGCRYGWGRSFCCSRCCGPDNVFSRLRCSSARSPW